MADNTTSSTDTTESDLKSPAEPEGQKCNIPAHRASVISVKDNFSKMNSEKAEAIARSRSSEMPEGCGFQIDVAPQSNSDVEVVFNERTAL